MNASQDPLQYQDIGGQVGRKNPVTVRDRGKEKIVVEISKLLKGYLKGITVFL